MKSGETWNKDASGNSNSSWDGLSSVEFAGNKPKFSPNQKYINDFGEAKLRETLGDRESLEGINESYLSQYEPDSKATAHDLALKESLDHFVVQRLSSDYPDMFIASQEFKNYCDYIMKIADKKKFESKNGEKTLYPEFSTNPVFRDQKMRELVFKTAYPNANLDKMNTWYDQHDAEYRKTIDYFVENGMKKHNKLSQKQMDIVGDYIYSGKSFDDGAAEAYSKYCFNDVDDDSRIKPSIPMLGALANYFASSYTIDEDVRDNSRIIIANPRIGKDKNGKEIREFSVGVSRKYGCVMEADHFLGMSLSSDDSLDKSRTNKSNDVYRFMMITFHELTHDHQKYSFLRGEKSSSAMSHILRGILNKDGEKCYTKKRKDGSTKEGSYVQVNHDNLETEIQADEEAWQQCRTFLVAHKDGFKVGGEQWQKCRDNADEVRARRAFVKKLASTGEEMPAVQYDISNLKERVKEQPELLQRYPQLGEYIDNSGNLRPELLFTLDIARDNYDNNYLNQRSDVFGTEIGAYMLTDSDTVNSVVEFIRDNKDSISSDQAKRLLSNLSHIIHQSIQKTRSLRDINFDNYDETKTRGKDLSPEEMKAALFEQYIKQNYHAVKLAEAIRTIHPDISDKVTEEERYCGSYYNEFLREEAELTPDFARKAVFMYERPGNPILSNIGKQMRQDYM